MFELFCIVVVILISLLFVRIKRTFNLLEGLSDDINEIRMKLGLGMEHRTDQQEKRYIEEVTEQYLVAGEGIEEIKDYLFSLDYSGIPARYATAVIESHEKGRKKYDKFIRGLIKDFNEAKICPKCKKIYYSYTEVDSPHRRCFKCSSDQTSVELITTVEYRKGINKR